MKNASKPLIFLAIFLAFNLSAHAGKFKVGKVSKEELRMTTYNPDPDARAVILYDKGSAFIDKYIIINKRHVRIKILTKEGFDKADFQFYFTGQEKDVVEGIKAYTFNLENGKVTREKLSNNDIIFEENINGLSFFHFSMPKVKVGSVIEVEYEYSSFNINDWYFQHDIPVVYSEFSAAINEEFFKYNFTIWGYEKVHSEPVRISYKTYRSYGDRTTIKTNVYNFSADTVPAFIEEPYMTTIQNFITKVSFEFRRGFIPGHGLVVYNESWATVSEKLLNHPSFGRQIVKNHLRKEAKEILEKTPVIKERVQLAREKIHSLIKFNGRDALFPKHENLRISLREKSGNVADINLNLIALLRKMDYQADPVVLSTRQHGLIHPAHPSVESLNYVLALVLIGDKKLLVDATDPHLPLEYIPFRCLNGSGILLDKKNPRKIELLTEEKYSRRTSMIIDFTEDTVSGSMKTVLSGYFANEEWKEMQEKEEKTYIAEQSVDLANWHITNFSSKWEGQSFVQHCEVNKANPFADKPDMVYLNSMYGAFFDKNPFQKESRKHPVDFGCPHNYNYQVILKLPDGYAIEEVPENAKVLLPDEGGSFIYSISVMDTQMVISSEFKINKVFYDQFEYPMIKQIFQRVVDKYNAKIALKRI